LSSTVFVNGITLTDADWFNDTDRVVYTIFGDPADVSAAFKVINNLTENTSPDKTTDFVPTYNASGLTAKKVKLSALGGITLGTPVASTSGTSIDFTSIPSGVKRITINFKGVSTNGTSPMQVQLGDSGGIENAGYVGGSGNASTSSIFSAGFRFIESASVAAANYSGQMILNLENSSNFTWTESSVVIRGDSAGQPTMTGGYKSLSAMLDRVRITTESGADTFDAGEINISYE